MTTALLVIDLQRDFCEGGALAVTGGNRVAQGIKNLLDSERVDSYDLLIASLDWHRAPPETNCGHFAAKGEEPDFVTSWPVHCVQWTDGAKLHPLLMPYSATFDFAVYKGDGTQSYSAFEGVTRTDGHSLLARLRSAGVTDIDVCGIATDYCVKASVLDALGTGFNVRVLQNLCAGVDKDASERALDQMMNEGAEIVS